MYRVEDFYQDHKEKLDLHLVGGTEGLKRKIEFPEAQRPGLSLSGYLKNYVEKRILIFGKIEMEYLKHLEAKVRKERLEAILTKKTPSVIMTRRYKPPTEIIHLCKKLKVPLFRTSMITMKFLNKLTLLLTEEFAPKLSCHGCFVEVFGVGVLIQGESSVGKSEAALGLIERGHRLVSDDIVRVKRKEGYLEGSGVELSRYHMEVRGIGIINVAHIYGAVCVQDNKSLDIVVKLESWNDDHFYDRLGLDEKTIEILGIKLPFHILPVKPGRDVALLLETLALNHRLKQMGYHSAKEFQTKLLATLTQKNKKKGF